MLSNEQASGRYLRHSKYERKILFSSTLSECRFETSESTRHELSKDLWIDDYKEFERREGLLKDDSFFNMSPYNYNIIRS